MMRPFQLPFLLRHSAFFLLSIFALKAQSSVIKYNDCATIETYYPENLYNPTVTNMGHVNRSALADHIRSTHRDVIPYTSSTEPDVWDALIVLDPGSGNNTVHLVYGSKDAPSTPHGTSTTWNREHLWPKSRGVSTSGPDYTDLHHLKPSDASVNTARNNRFFGSCGIDAPMDECYYPAHSEAASDTERDAGSWLPPADVRGDIARALFYMALRYDGSDPYTSKLELSDCPVHDTAGSTTNNLMGYKSQLLFWHHGDPVTDEERLRNDIVCGSYQGNRNPYVDFPELVAMHFGSPSLPPNPALGGGYCSCNKTSLSCEAYTSSGVETTTAPSYLTEPPGKSTTIIETVPSSLPKSCRGMKRGDVIIRGFNTIGRDDNVILAALTNLPPGAVLYLTDNAWTGSEFRNNEGTLKLTIPEPGVSSGSIIGQGGEGTQYETPYDVLWEKHAGSFSLSMGGDNLFVYCLNGESGVTHLFGLTYTKGGWKDANFDDDTMFGTDDSALPQSLQGTVGSVYLSHQADNYWYDSNGPSRNGTQIDLLSLLSDEWNWIGSDTDFMDPDVVLEPFFVMDEEGNGEPLALSADGTCMGLKSGDVMLTGYNSDGRDDVVVMAALSELPSGASVFLTDNAWTGTKFRSNEGTKRLTIPDGGIPSGSIVVYDTATTMGTSSFLTPYNGLWENEGGTFSLSTSGESIFLYCLSEDTYEITVLSGLTYSADGWMDPDPDETIFGTTGSALPSSLQAGAYLSLPHKDNSWYDGPRSEEGKFFLLQYISDRSYWNGSNTELMDPNIVLAPFSLS